MGFSPCHSRIRNIYEFFSEPLDLFRVSGQQLDGAVP